MSDTYEAGAARPAVFWSSLVLALSPVLAALVIAPARSGPFCFEDCVSYPYRDIAGLYPAEYWWMYVMTVAAFALIVLGAAAVSLSPASHRVLARIGNSFALVAGTVLAICYIVQIEVVQPSVLAGEWDGISLLTQYNAHGVFIALEDLGYLTLAIALAGLTAALVSLGRLFAAAFAVAIGGAVLVVGVWIYITLVFGVERGYFFEVAAIVIDWLVMLVAGALLAIGVLRLPGGRRKAIEPPAS